ncbi:MAG: PD-(D/E)XK nuclease family protein [Alphaproteobacteria bacterium]|nr:PD-(D/E)XK nuclease family protein [Alphaproteobacteria bacterium]
MNTNKNIFCASNPAKLSEALWSFLEHRDFSSDIIFLPSRRAVRSVEKMLVEKAGGAVLLPKLIALGEGIDDDEYDAGRDTVSNLERVIVLAKMLSAQDDSGIVGTIPVAKDLIRMMDYLENENASRHIDWIELIGEKYAEHFQEKARFLNLACTVMPLVFKGRDTIVQKRNMDIRQWITYLEKHKLVIDNRRSKIIVCGSTASVPATSDLMEYIAGLDNGYIILPGCIQNPNPNICNPYYSELKFLERINVIPGYVKTIDVGESPIDFFNDAFSDTIHTRCDAQFASRFNRIDCDRESEEAEVVAEIATSKSGQGKTVLIVSPDISAAQRICESLDRRGVEFDFSGGKKGSVTSLGRWILRQLDDKKNIFDTLLPMIEASGENIVSEESLKVIEAMKSLSDILKSNGLELSLADLRAVTAEALNGVSVRPPMVDGCLVSLVGTIESRMQSADVIILTGLNEGMFPALGYENPWLPRRVADAIGLPPPERKVSLMAMDFITLSCGSEVYWTRSKMSGGGETTESRFLSRVAVSSRNAAFASSLDAVDWLACVRALDEVPYKPLDRAPPRPPAVNDDVYVTELELLIHNPYAFYARHILRLKPKDNFERDPDARDFGIMVHSVIERYAKGNVDNIVAELDKCAREILPEGSVLFHFWHKRFLEIAPAVTNLLSKIENPEIEVSMECKIAGRGVKARADMAYDNTVLDVKTGAAPNRRQLEEGNMPQLPLEAYMRGAKIIQFLQLRNRDVRLIEYSGAEVRGMIDAAVAKTTALFKQYGQDFEPYEYRETGDDKYKLYDDLARR